MSKIISIFNNKGGVGKTTYLYHVAHLLSRQTKLIPSKENEGEMIEVPVKVLMVDCDSQCNLTAYALEDKDVVRAWSSSGNSIYRVIEKVDKGIGDISNKAPIKLTDTLYLTPGDINLSNYEDKLGDSFTRAKGGSEADLRVQTAIFRYVQNIATKHAFDIVFMDLGPNLGALNRSILSGSDYFILPMSVDLFSLKGVENLSKKLIIWNREWKQMNDALGENPPFDIPQGKPIFMGYVVQQHNIRKNTTNGMTRGWNIFMEQMEPKIKEDLVNKLSELGQVIPRTEYKLGTIPNLHSLIPYALEARKPVFDCNGHDGLTGGHITTAKESKQYFNGIVSEILSII